MIRCAGLALLALLFLASCADLALLLPTGPDARLYRNCHARAPIGECPPSAGAYLIRYRWRF